jgi:hypothetical protein
MVMGAALTPALSRWEREKLTVVGLVSEKPYLAAGRMRGGQD